MRIAQVATIASVVRQDAERIEVQRGAAPGLASLTYFYLSPTAALTRRATPVRENPKEPRFEPRIRAELPQMVVDTHERVLYRFLRILLVTQHVPRVAKAAHVEELHELGESLRIPVSRSQRDGGIDIGVHSHRVRMGRLNSPQYPVRLPRRYRPRSSRSRRHHTPPCKTETAVRQPRARPAPPRARNMAVKLL